MATHDEVYSSGLQYILDNGVKKVDRTGTGTISVTGMLLRYDLRDGTIPLITTKKVNIDPLRQELEWFIEGTGSVKRLNERGVKIWDNWATDDGHLNFVYGYQWRFWPAVFSDGYQYVKDQIAYQPRFYSIPVHAVQLHQQPGYFTLSDPEINDEWYLWRNMIANQGEYELCSEWKLFENFAHDIRYLPGYLHWKKLPNDLILSPLWSGAHIASRDTCAFISLDEYISIRDGESNNALPAKDGYVVRRKLFHDQLQNVVDQIKTNPYSRRIKVNAWNVDLLDQMQLPPCHYDFTFVNQPLDSGEIETSLQLNMRSNDYCLGNPFNIAQYAILLRMVCHLCGTKPGDLIYVGTDVHVYLNHIEKAKEQLLRTPYASPTMRFADKVYETIDDFKAEDIIIENYQHHPFIKFEVAV